MKIPKNILSWPLWLYYFRSCCWRKRWLVQRSFKRKICFYCWIERYWPLWIFVAWKSNSTQWWRTLGGSKSCFPKDDWCFLLNKNDVGTICQEKPIQTLQTILIWLTLTKDDYNKISLGLGSNSKFKSQFFKKSSSLNFLKNVKFI